VLATGTDALLRGGGAGVVPRLLAQEDVLELVHPRVGEEERRVVLRDEGRALDHPVPALLEVAEERASDLVCAQHRRALAETVWPLFGIAVAILSGQFHRLEAFESGGPARPQSLEAAPRQLRGKTPTNQKAPQSGQAPACLDPAVLPPVASGDFVEDSLLGDVAERRREARLDLLPAHTPLAEALANPRPAVASRGEAAAGERFGELVIVDVVLLLESHQGVFDLLAGVSALRQGATQLVLRVVS
jgi:hypothetical protein